MNIAIIGPTAVGKTKLSILLAKMLNLPIVNCDTVQFWKGVENISCSPTNEEKLQANHLLFNVLNTDEKPSLGWWIKNIKQIGNKVIIGGSFFYPYSLWRGVPELGIKKDTNEFITNIHKNDTYRYNRHLEFFKQTGYSFDDYPLKYKENVFFISLLAEEKLWQENIINRISQNFHSWVKEVEQFHNNIMLEKIIGWKEIKDYLDKKCNKDVTINRIYIKTLQYGKKQKKFIKKSPGIQFFVNKSTNWNEIAKEALNEFHNYCHAL